MRELGFGSVPCGPDGPDAWAIAQQWQDRWIAARKGEAPSPAMVSAANLSPDQVEGLTIYPPRSIGEGFRRFRGTDEWKRKEPRTREDWWRVWRRIKPVFGDCDPKTVDARRHRCMADHDRADGIAPRGAPLHQDLAGAVAQAGGARLLRARRRSGAWHHQPRRQGPLRRVDRGRGGAARQARMARRLSWPRCSDRRHVVEPTEPRRRAYAPRNWSQTARELCSSPTAPRPASRSAAR